MTLPPSAFAMWTAERPMPAARTAKDYDEWVTSRTDLEEIQEQLEFLKDAHQEQQK